MDMVRECKKCVNNTRNPYIKILDNGYCTICDGFRHNFTEDILDEEYAFFRSFLRGTDPHDVMVGLSGGKDSSATLYRLKKMGFQPLAFTFDIGYYPPHIKERSAVIARQYDTEHTIIDIRPYIRKLDYKCYEQTANLYDYKESPILAEGFSYLYQYGREHYSIKCEHAFPFVRTCQLCRRTVIRAYYGEAVKRGIPIVVLGINEWATMSAVEGGGQSFSAIRKLQPSTRDPFVYIVHLPFLMRATLAGNKKILREMQWEMPPNESFVETNGNSCLFALAAEAKATRMLGFHPDTTRLAREVTAAFLPKKIARESLQRVHESRYSVRQILQKANIM